MSDFYLDPTLYDGRPVDLTGRDAVEIACYDFLDRIGVPYCRIDHDETPSIEACGEVEKLLGIEICKNLFLCNRQNAVHAAAHARPKSLPHQGAVRAAGLLEAVLRRC